MQQIENNPYLTRKLYAPIDKEIAIDRLEVLEGEVPTDLYGSYVRNGPNPHHHPKGRYHWFDGDGMLHAVHIQNGEVSYRNRYVRTNAFEREREANQALWVGRREDIRSNPPDQPMKDTSNTDVIFHRSHLLSLWYTSGKMYKIDPRTLDTVEVEDFGGKLTCHVSAHSKVDEHTGELLFFDYGNQYPYMVYGVASADGQLAHCVPIELPGPRLPHDMAFTTHYSILMDLPLFNDPQALQKGRYKLGFYRELPSRFGIIPRYGASESIRWFEAEPCYIYHVINAWEEGDEVVLVSCRAPEPYPAHTENLGPIERMMAVLKVDFELYCWRFNMRTGAVKEGKLDDRNTEFPMMNQLYAGVPSRYSYNVSLSSAPTMEFDGLVKYDIQTGQSQALSFGEGRYGNEAAFAPRRNAKSEDDGYVVTYVYDERTDQSELVIIDALRFQDGPVARVRIPQRIPMGFHATWVQGEKME